MDMREYTENTQICNGVCFVPFLLATEKARRAMAEWYL